MGRIRFLPIAAVMTVLLVAPPALAGDAEDVQAVISAQLQAFRSDDADGAYAYTAPNVRQLFRTRDAFLGMVRSGYDPVYRSSAAVFGSIRLEGAGFRQEVYITDREGLSWSASYTLARQPDGSMKITGCSIRRGDDISA